jgi:hypothetical protein
MTTEDQRQECVNLIAHQILKSSEWRFIQAKRFPGDERNRLAAKRLADLATAATELPDDIWEGLKEHYHWSNEKFGEVISATNRNVVFRYSTPDIAAYTRNLLLNVRNAFTT